MERYNDELYHWGVKGMKWGVRRYQNDDGTLTNAGKKRYARDAREKEFNKYDNDSGKYYKSSKKNGRTDLEFDAQRYVTEDMTRTKRVVDETNTAVNRLSQINNNRKAKANPRMDLSNMTDKELRDQINRELLERQYNDVFNPPTVSKGKERTKQILEVAGTALTLTGSALAIALSMRDLLGGKKQ